MKPPKGSETQKRSTGKASASFLARRVKLEVGEKIRRECGVPSIFAVGKNLDAGRIYSARSDKINRVEPPRAAEPKKKDRKDFIFPVLLFGKGSQHRGPGEKSPGVRRPKHFCHRQKS